MKVLNLGSGQMLREECINFDYVMFERGGLKTDVIGRIEDATDFFEEGSFDQILCFHVLEHFYLADALKVLRDCYTLLRSGGMLIVEVPGVLGMYEWFWVKHKNVKALIQSLYGDERYRLKLGDEWMHKWGWTADTMAEEMEKIGFKEIKRSGGTSHGNDMRDFRVTGLKPKEGIK